MPSIALKGQFFKENKISNNSNLKHLGFEIGRVVHDFKNAQIYPFGRDKFLDAPPQYFVVFAF